MKRVFMEGVKGNRTKGRTPLWIVEYWVPWKYYVGKGIDRWMHLLRKIPGVRYLVDRVWEEYYYPLFWPENRMMTEVTWDKVSNRWDWAKEEDGTGINI